MTTHKDTGTVAHTEVHHRDFRVAVAFRVGLIEKTHSFYTTLAHIKHKGEQFIYADIGACSFGHGIFYNGIYVVVLIAEIGGMTCIGRHSFATVDGKLLEAAQIRIWLGKDAGYSLQGHRIVGGSQKLHLRQIRQLNSLPLGLTSKDILQLECANDVTVEAGIIEVGVGYGCK